VKLGFERRKTISAAARLRVRSVRSREAEQRKGESDRDRETAKRRPRFEERDRAIEISDVRFEESAAARFEGEERESQ
jgi:hypothetical protein